MSGTLEAQYRKLMRWYPRAWRDEHAGAFIGMSMDDADAHGRTSIPPGEKAAIRWHGLSARAGMIVPAAARDRASALVLGTGTTVLLVMTLVSFWSPWSSTALTVSAQTRPAGPFSFVLPTVAVVWVGALVLALRSRWGWGRGALLFAAALAAFNCAVPAALGASATSLDRLSSVCLAVAGMIAVLGTPRFRLWIVLGALVGLAGTWVMYALERPVAEPGRWQATAEVWARSTDLTYLCLITGVLAAAVAAVGHRAAAAGVGLALVPVTVALVYRQGFLSPQGLDGIYWVLVIGLILLIGATRRPARATTIDQTPATD